MNFLVHFCAAAAAGLSAQLSVGPNVQVSLQRSGDTHYEVLAAADSGDPDRMIVGAIVYPDGGGDPGTIVYATRDGGLTWRATLGGDELLHTGDPAPAYGLDGVAYYTASSLAPNAERRMLLFKSVDGGTQWQRLPPLTYSDRQYITVDTTGSRYRGRIYVNGNNRVPREITDFVVFHSADGGATFQGPGTRPGYGAFITPEMGNAVVAADGTLIGLFTQVAGDRVVLNAISSSDGGETLNPPSQVDEFVTPGGRKGRNNNVNAQPMLAIDERRDALYAVWPDRRSGVARVLFARSNDQGRTWSKGRVISDAPEHDTTDQLMPNIAVNRDGVVGVSWYDRRDSPDNLGWDARFTASLDGGGSWLPSVRVSEAGNRIDAGTRWTSLRPAPPRGAAQADKTVRARLTLNSFFYMGGDTAGLVADARGVFHAIWVDNHTGVPQVWTAPIRLTNGSAPRLATTALVDVSDKTQLELSNPVFDSATSLLTTTAQLRNASSEALHGPFRVRVAALASELGSLAVMQPDNDSNGVGAEWDFADAALAPGALSTGRLLRFRLAGRTPYRQGDRYLLGVMDLDATVHAQAHATPPPARFEPANPRRP